MQYSDSVVLRAAQRVEIDVPVMPLVRVMRRAIKHYNDRAAFGARPATLDSSPVFLARIAVNYLRHHSQYDHSRNAIRGTRVAEQAGTIVKVRTLQQIAAMYPTFADECARQAREATSPAADR